MSRSNFVRVVAFSCALSLPSVALAQTDPAQAREALAVASAWIDATGWLMEARDALASGKANDRDANAVMLGVMIANRKAKTSVDNALTSLPPRDQFTRNEAAHSAIDGFASVIETIADALDQEFKVFESVAAASDQKELAKAMASFATASTQLDEAWKLWVQATILVTYSFVDSERATDGKLRHLRVTTDERAALLKRIESRFPKAPVTVATGQHPIEASIGALKQFLNGGHLSADQR